jgi:hypothetical protein
MNLSLRAFSTPMAIKPLTDKAVNGAARGGGRIT